MCPFTGSLGATRRDERSGWPPGQAGSVRPAVLAKDGQSGSAMDTRIHTRFPRWIRASIAGTVPRQARSIRQSIAGTPHHRTTPAPARCERSGQPQPPPANQTSQHPALRTPRHRQISTSRTDCAKTSPDRPPATAPDSHAGKAGPGTAGPSQHDHPARVDRDRRRPRDPDTMATSATWPMHGGCADLHRCVRGTQTSAVSGGACLEY